MKSMSTMSMNSARQDGSPMRRLTYISLLLLLTLGWAGVSQAAMVHVRSSCTYGANLYAGTSSYVYSYPTGTAPTAGNLVIIATAQGANRTVSSIAGTAITYTINGASTQNGGSLAYASIWKGIASGTDTTATVTISGTSSDPAVVCFAEFSGADSDQSGSTANGAANNNTTTHNSGSVTPPTADNVVIAAYERGGAPGDYTEDGAFTSVTTGWNAFYFAYLIQAAATAQEYNATSSANRYTAMRIGAFAGTASGAITPRGLLLGVYP